MKIQKLFVAVFRLLAGNGRFTRWTHGPYRSWLMSLAVMAAICVFVIVAAARIQSENAKDSWGTSLLRIGPLPYTLLHMHRLARPNLQTILCGACRGARRHSLCSGLTTGSIPPTGIRPGIRPCRRSLRKAGSRPFWPVGTATCRMARGGLKTPAWQVCPPPTSSSRWPISKAAAAGLQKTPFRLMP